MQPFYSVTNSENCIVICWIKNVHSSDKYKAKSVIIGLIGGFSSSTPGYYLWTNVTYHYCHFIEKYLMKFLSKLRLLDLTKWS